MRTARLLTVSQQALWPGGVSAQRVYLPGGYLPGGTCPEGVPAGGCTCQGVPTKGDTYAGGCTCLGGTCPGTPPTVNRMTDRQV